LAAVVVLVALGATVFFVVRFPSLRHTIWPYAGSGLVTVASIIAIVSDMVAIGDHKRRIPRKSNVIKPNLPIDDHFVDRGPELSGLLQALSQSAYVNCCGPQGVGKSYFLAYIADIINGKRKKRPEDPDVSALWMTAALYVDLATATGQDDVARQACETLNAVGATSWQALVDHVTQVFGGHSILLILDNVDDPGLWEWLGRACQTYRARRPQDRIILGSIEPIRMQALDLAQFRVAAFDKDAVHEYIVASKPDATDDLEALYSQSDGHPLFLRFLLANGSATDWKDVPELSDYLERRVLPRVSPEVRIVLAYVAVLALVTRSVPLVDLQRRFGDSVNGQLKLAEDHSLITARVGSEVTIHNLVRDDLLRCLGTEVRQAACDLTTTARSSGQDVRAALFACLADPIDLDGPALDRLWGDVIMHAVRVRDYSLLGALSREVDRNDFVRQYVQQDRDRNDLFQFGRAAYSAGIGSYETARQLLESTSVSQERMRHGTSRLNELQMELLFLNADVTHLLNEYDSAIEMFWELEDWATRANDQRHKALALFGIGHSMRHQGRDLSGALEAFAQAINVAEQCNDVTARVGAIVGTTGILVFLGAVTPSTRETLDQLESDVLLASNPGHHLLEIWKSQAQVAWCEDRRSDARRIIDDALTKAEALNDRLMHNLRFEKAEFERLESQPDKAMTDYLLVWEAGRNNHDRNLVCNALLGIICSELAMGAWSYHETKQTAQQAAFDALDIAQEANIYRTTLTAKRVISALDGGPDISDLRLVVF